MVNRKYRRVPRYVEIRLCALKNHRSNFVSRAKRIQFRDPCVISVLPFEFQLHACAMILRDPHAQALPIDRSR